jgi:hypothetical protein
VCGIKGESVGRVGLKGRGSGRGMGVGEERPTRTSN